MVSLALAPNDAAPGKSVGIPCAAYTAMAERWRLVHDLRGGTHAMRAAGKRWLPKEEGESDDAYKVRLSRSILFAAYDDAIGKLTSKPFAKPINLPGREKLAEALALIEDDADNRKSSLTLFAKDFFEDALDHGLSHFVVDFPRRAGPTTVADVQRDGVHPYFTHAPAASVIGWQSTFDAALGREVLINVRIKEERTEPSGPWGQRCVNYVKVWTRTEYQVWRELDDTKDEYALVEEESGQHSLGRVPLVTVYFNRTGFMTGEPVLEGLAWLNVAHWQKASDLNNSEHYACVPFLSERGCKTDDLGKIVAIGSGRVRQTSKGPQDYDIGWVETSGTAIKPVADSLDKIEARMQELGMQPMLEPTTPRTATEVGAANANTHTSLRQFVGLVNDAFYEGYQVAALYLSNVKLPDKFSVSIFSEWDVATGDQSSMAVIERAFDKGLITRETYLIELKRRGFMHEGFDVKKELESTENPSMPAPLTPEQKAALEEARRGRGVPVAA